MSALAIIVLAGVIYLAAIERRLARISRLLSRADRGGASALTTDSDQPIRTTADG